GEARGFRPISGGGAPIRTLLDGVECASTSEGNPIDCLSWPCRMYKKELGNALLDASQFSEREARAVAALNHPRICQLYDVGPDYAGKPTSSSPFTRPPVAGVHVMVTPNGPVIEPVDGRCFQSDPCEL